MQRDNVGSSARQALLTLLCTPVFPSRVPGLGLSILLMCSQSCCDSAAFDVHMFVVMIYGGLCHSKMFAN